MVYYLMYLIDTKLQVHLILLFWDALFYFFVLFKFLKISAIKCILYPYHWQDDTCTQVQQKNFNNNIQ